MGASAQGIGSPDEAQRNPGPAPVANSAPALRTRPREGASVRSMRATNFARIFKALYDFTAPAVSPPTMYFLNA